MKKHKSAASSTATLVWKHMSACRMDRVGVDRRERENALTGLSIMISVVPRSPFSATLWRPGAKYVISFNTRTTFTCIFEGPMSNLVLMQQLYAYLRFRVLGRGRGLTPYLVRRILAASRERMCSILLKARDETMDAYIDEIHRRV